MADKNPKDAVNSYITDMLSLEQHIHKAISSQIEDLKSYPEITAELDRFQSTIEFHVSSLEGLITARGGKGAPGAVKKAGSAILGLAAGAVDLVRNEGLPKNLRDDYTAFSLASIGYVMLHTTALSLGDREAATLAHRHLSDYAKVVMTLHNVIPPAVVRFLRDEGLPANESVLSEVAGNIENVWKSESGVPSANEVNISRR